MGIVRRAVFDLNRCEFQGRLMADPVMSVFKKHDSTYVDRVDFTIISNSNPYNVKSLYFVPMFAYGFQAHAIKSKFFKGTKAFVICEFKPVMHKGSKKKGTETRSEPLFEVKTIVLEAYPEGFVPPYAENQDEEE